MISARQLTLVRVIFFFFSYEKGAYVCLCSLYFAAFFMFLYCFLFVWWCQMEISIFSFKNWHSNVLKIAVQTIVSHKSELASICIRFSEQKALCLIISMGILDWLRNHDKTAFVHGRLNFYDSNEKKWNKRCDQKWWSETTDSKQCAKHKRMRKIEAWMVQ